MLENKATIEVNLTAAEWACLIDLVLQIIGALSAGKQMVAWTVDDTGDAFCADDTAWTLVTLRTDVCVGHGALTLDWRVSLHLLLFLLLSSAPGKSPDGVSAETEAQNTQQSTGQRTTVETTDLVLELLFGCSDSTSQN